MIFCTSNFKTSQMNTGIRTTSETTKVNLLNFIQNLIGEDEAVVQIKFASQHKEENLVFFENTQENKLRRENALKMHFLEINGHAPNIDGGIRYPIFNDAILCTSAGLDPEKSIGVLIKTISKIEGIEITDVIKRLQKENVIFPQTLLQKIVVM